MSGQVMLREVKVFDSASLTALAQNFGTETDIPTYKVAFVNASNRDVLIADGSGMDDFYLPAGSTLNVGEGLAQSAMNLNIKAEFPNQTQFTITGVTGVAGTGKVVATIFGA